MSQKNRIQSIDILRGLTILAMLFVNDLAGVENVPPWLKHAPPRLDGMTFVDVVFPAFLFIVGMAFPFSLGARRDREESWLRMGGHLLIRTLGLVFIGVLMVNSHAVSDACLLPRPVWTVLMYAGVILLWTRGAGTVWEKRFNRVGAGLLLVLVLIFRREGVSGLIQLGTSWWGILGLIGWAYLVSALFYLPLRKKATGLLLSMFILYFFYMSVEAGLLEGWLWLNRYFDPSYTFGSHAALIMSGVMLGGIIKTYHHESRIKCLGWGFVYSLGLFFSGVLLHQLNDLHSMFYYDKNLGTVPWGLVSAAVTIWVWMLVYWLADIRGATRWAAVLRPAGRNPLFAYILAPALAALFALTGFSVVWTFLGRSFFPGVLRSAGLALFVIWLTSMFEKRGGGLRL